MLEKVEMAKTTWKQVLKNYKLILQGVYYSIFKSQYVEKIAKERKAICEACPFIDRIGTECFAAGTQPCCGKCGCSLHFKQHSLSSSCGDEENPRWKAVMSDEQAEKYQTS